MIFVSRISLGKYTTSEEGLMKDTVPMKRSLLKVPGASIYYEVRGSGPVLLMMPGGPADAGTFRRIAGYLESDYTVVTYDPRGLSHSPLDGPVRDDRIVEIFADDAYRLLAATGKEPAFVFGSSGGAVIALELAVRHPEQIRIFVPHEPPALALPPAPARARASGRPWQRSSKRTGRLELGRPCRSSWFRPESGAVRRHLRRASRHRRCARGWRR